MNKPAKLSFLYSFPKLLIILTTLLSGNAGRPLYGQERFRIVSYNVENLFDCTHDTGKNDEEFLPEGARHWTPGRYYRKLCAVARVILACGEWDTPALVGLCEVENDSTVVHLLNRTPLRSQHYRYVMTHSPDARGIDVALLYQRDRFALIGSAAYRLTFSHNRQKRSRDILHVWGRVVTGDTLDIFVCHFPSRYGGELASMPDRRDAALLLKEKTDSVLHRRRQPAVIVMGDFNDTPLDASLRETLEARRPEPPYRPYSLYNLFYPPVCQPVAGSHKYQGEWGQLDQFILNGALLDTANTVRLVPNSATVFTPPFLFTKDKTYRGTRPKRTYYGFKYEGGYSDHLPIMMDFYLSLFLEKRR